jgi:hypothetical protein
VAWRFSGWGAGAPILSQAMSERGNRPNRRMDGEIEGGKIVKAGVSPG